MKKRLFFLSVFTLQSLLLLSQKKATCGISDGKNLFALKVSIDTLSGQCFLEDILMLPDGDAKHAIHLDSARYYFTDDPFPIPENGSYQFWGDKFFLQDINMDGNTDVCAVHYTWDEEEHRITYRYYWIYDPVAGNYHVDIRFSMLHDPVTDLRNKSIIDRELYGDSCVLTKYQLLSDILDIKATRSLGYSDNFTMDSILFIIPHNDALCNDDHQCTTDDHINYEFPYDDADLLDGGFTLIPQFPFEKITVTENFTLAYGAKVSETEGWMFYDSTFSDSVNRFTCFSYSPAKTLKNDGWYTYATSSVATSDIATHCPKPKVKFKTADNALRQRDPDFYGFIYEPQNYSDDSPQRKKQEELDHSTQLYYYYENITITIQSNGRTITKILHLYIRHGEC